MSVLRYAAPLLVALLPAGCAGLHRDTPPAQIYVLRAAVPEASPDGSESSGVAAPARTEADAAPTLQVSLPSAAPGLGTELIALVRSDHRMDYYADSRWAAPLPEMVETLAVDTLRASGAWRAVHESPSPFAPDYLLEVGIRRFEADYTSGRAAPTVHVVLDCALTRRPGRELVASFAAEGSADAGENRLSVVVSAFERAANAALTTLADRSAAAARVASRVAANP